MTLHLRVICDGKKEKITGREIISRQKQRQKIEQKTKYLNLDTFKKMICQNDPLLDQWKIDVNGIDMKIFFLELFKTPGIDTQCDNQEDESIPYFWWNTFTNEWRSTYWRINDTWNTKVAIIILE